MSLPLSGPSQCREVDLDGIQLSEAGYRGMWFHELVVLKLCPFSIFVWSTPLDGTRAYCGWLPCQNK